MSAIHNPSQIGKSRRRNDALTQLGHHSDKHSAGESSIIADLCTAFEESQIPLVQKLETFPRHVRRQDLARFLTRYEVFKMALPVHGSVVECGVFAGGGLITWSHCSSILEPYNHTRRVIGFDTFSGFPGVHRKDTSTGRSEHLKTGAFETGASVYEELRTLSSIHDRNRPLGHIPKVELVKGNACETIPEYIASHPHLLISLLYLDFDLYEPTKAALDHLVPRVVQGGIIAFDELNSEDFPGETVAAIESEVLSLGRLQRLPHDPYISFIIKP
jgi:hypothetical protein